MAKALFLGLPLHGHTNPSLPLVRALVERGDEVVYFSSEPFAAKIEQTGARYRPYRNAFLSESLYHGVPLIVVPQMGEQEVVARQVEALGVGLCLAKRDVTADRLRQSVNRVLGDERFRAQAA